MRGALVKLGVALLFLSGLLLLINPVPVGGQNECKAVYNQSGTYICLPIAANISTAVGSIMVNPLSETEFNIIESKWN